MNQFGPNFEFQVLMNKSIIALFLFVFLSAEAQKTVSGTFSPAEDYSWIIAYRLKPGTQVYVADAAIKKGQFSMKFPENAVSGTYRMVYAVPQEEFYFDILYNGKEDISLSFNAQKGVSFADSEENKIFSDYFKQINEVKKKIISFYSEGNNDVSFFNALVDKQTAIQKIFSSRAKGLQVYDFIVANTPYTPSDYESIIDYVANGKASYFDYLDFKNPALQASGFLTDKIANYVFTALPLFEMTPLETEMAMQRNVSEVNDKLNGVSDSYKLHIFYTLWAQAAVSGFNDLSDNIYSDYLRSLAIVTNNQEIINEIDVHNRLRIGAVAPDIIWKKDKKSKSLHKLSAADNYILVFWSSTCGHCLKELPLLHENLKAYGNVKVIAVGLEDDNISWKTESAKLENFEHAISLGKWESDYAQLYAINQTPSYFLLNKSKEIIAKPEDQLAVIELLKSKE